MANPEITNVEMKDGVRGVKESEQGEITLAGADTIARLTILGRITATGKYGFYASGAVDGTEVPCAVSLSEVVSTGAGDFPLGVMLAGHVDEAALIIDGSAAGVGITPAIKDALRTFGIFVESYNETARQDNQ